MPAELGPITSLSEYITTLKQFFLLISVTLDILTCSSCIRTRDFLAFPKGSLYKEKVKHIKLP